MATLSSMTIDDQAFAPLRYWFIGYVKTSCNPSDVLIF